MPTPENPHLAEDAVALGERGGEAAVLGVHGRTQSPRFIAQLRDELAIGPSYWLAPGAHESSWYPHRFMDLFPPDDPWLPWSMEAIGRQLDRLELEGYPPERVFLLGFSQGACLLSQFALANPRRYAGLVLFTGGFIGPMGSLPDLVGDFADTPTLLATVESDPWVPLDRFRETEATFRALGARVTSLIEPGDEHGVTSHAMNLARGILSPAIDPTTAE